MALDGVEVAEFLRGKLHKSKIILLGLSWGSILGVRMVKTRPDLFYAYVGTGQVVNQYNYKAIAYAQLLAEARARNVFVFHGALNNVTPAQPAGAYVESITTPQKQFVLVENAGHNVMATRSDEFLALLLQRVRPLAIQP